jgi:hypothetical protein
MPMNIGPKLNHWSYLESAVRGRPWKPHQRNWCTVLPCGYRGNFSQLPPPNVPTSPTSRPGWESTSPIFGPYQPPGMPRHPYSFSKTWPPPRMSFYGKAFSEEPCKPRMSAHTESSTGAVRLIPSSFMVLRRQSPLTTWSRSMSYMLTPNLLHHWPFFPVSRLALDGVYAFRITWGCSSLSGEGRVVWRTPLTRPPT